MIYGIIQNNELALADLTQAIVNPTYDILYMNRGNVHYNLEDYEQALADYHRYLDLAGDDADPSIIERIHELEAMLGVTPTPGG